MSLLGRSIALLIAPSIATRDYVYVALAELNENADLATDAWAWIMLVAMSLCVLSWLVNRASIGRIGAFIGLLTWIATGIMFMLAGLWLQVLTQAVGFIIYWIVVYYYLGRIIPIKDY